MMLGAALVACDRPQPAPADGSGPAQERPLAAADLEREVARLAAEHAGEGLWPGFDPLAVPLAVYDGKRTFLFRHPSPPEGFVPVPDTDPVAFQALNRRNYRIGYTTC
ncbi:hypothetical protein [Luteimonas salinilitoris]|uniref:Uncharacterized protein n=1 Tax=Luteimonas salinilitoris TaxID=3237697 RepID=A0ABV4HRV0_9GAMM